MKEADMKKAQKLDGSGRVHLSTLGRRGGRVLACTGRTMYDLVPVAPDAVVDCAGCAKKEHAAVPEKQSMTGRGTCRTCGEAVESRTLRGIYRHEEA